jgi:hypothetical protein
MHEERKCVFNEVELPLTRDERVYTIHPLETAERRYYSTQCTDIPQQTGAP